MDRLRRVFNREWSGLHEAAFLLAGTALASQILGLFRDRLLAGHFGATGSLDVYYAAFRVPDFLYVSIASFVAVTVLIPFLLKQIEVEDDKIKAQHFIDSILTAFVLAMVVISFFVMFFLPYLAHMIVPGFSASEQKEFVLLARVLLLSPFLLGISNLFGAITQSLRRFFVFALGPVLYNLGIIIGVLFFMPYFGLLGVVFGVILGALLHVSIQIPVLLSEGILPRFTLHIDRRAVYAVTKLSIPRTLALSATHIAMMVLIAIASRIEAGSIAVFTLAMNLQSIPLSIVGMSYSVAAFPTLAKLWNAGNHDLFQEQIGSATRHIIFWSFPAIIMFIVLRAQIVRTILGSGAFDWNATRLTAAALALFAISVVAQNLVLLYTRAFYAMGKTKVTLVANATGAFLIIVFSLLFLYFFNNILTVRFFAESLLRVSDLPGSALLMLPLGYSIGMIANLSILLFFLHERFPHLWDEIKTAFLHSFTASVVMGFVSYHSLQVLADVLDIDSFVGIFFQGLLSGVIGICSGIFLLRLMNNRELQEIWISLHHKFWKSEPIITEQGGI
jgi:putative peptidoglycan lipid II flippase